MYESFGDDERAFNNPGNLDQLIRQAFHMCWLTLPPDRRSIDEVERQMRRLFDRIIRDFREDCEEFGS